MTPISFLELIEVLVGPLTVLIAVLLAHIAYQQMRTNSRRLTLELFEKRFEIYEACRDLIIDAAGRQRNVQYEWFMEFDGAIQPAEFLLEADARDFLTSLRNHASELVAIEEELGDQPEQNRTDELRRERRELRRWFRGKLPELNTAFRSSLNLSLS